MSNDIDELNKLTILKKKKKQSRKKKYKHQRLDMEEHFKMCLYTNGFQTRYHMSKKAFDKLVDILKITVDKLKSKNSTSGNAPISPLMIVAIGLQFLSGEKAKSLADTFGISISSTHRVIDKFLSAVDLSSHPHLSTDLLPNSYNERIQVARQWEERSSAFG